MLLPESIEGVATALARSPDWVRRALIELGYEEPVDGLLTLEQRAALLKYVPAFAPEQSPEPRATRTEEASRSESESSSRQHGSIGSGVNSDEFVRGSDKGVAELRARIDDLEQCLDATRMKLAAAERRADELSAEAVRLRPLQFEVMELKRRHEKMEGARDYALEEARKLRLEMAELRVAAELVPRLQADLTNERRRAVRAREAARRRLESLQAECVEYRRRALRAERESKLAQAGFRRGSVEDLANRMVRNRSALKQPLRVSTVAIHGQLPSAEPALRALAKRMNWSILKPGSSDVELLIVGRSGWTEDVLDRQLAARDGMELRVLSQELLLVSLWANSDPFLCMPKKDLLAHGKEHPALKYLIDSELNWPCVAVPVVDRTDGWADGELAEQSPLAKLGYRAGKLAHYEGVTESDRRRILRSAFLGELPFVHSKEYMQAWGKPGNRHRLRRIATHLAWLLRSGTHTKQYATEDWARDLNWLKKEFFRPWMNFKWPSYRV